MIHHETWHKEAVSREKEISRLVNLGRRGLISPEEFMPQMLALFRGLPEELLKHDEETDSYSITEAWSHAHSDWVQEAKDLAVRLGKGGDLEAAFDQAPYENLQKAILKLALQFIGWSEVAGERPVTTFPPGGFPNFPVRIPPPISSEMEFNQRVQNLLQSAREVVSELEGSSE